MNKNINSSIGQIERIYEQALAHTSLEFTIYVRNLTIIAFREREKFCYRYILTFS